MKSTNIIRKLLTLSYNAPARVMDDSELVLHDRNRVSMQLTALSISHFEKLLLGKKGFIQGKWVT